MITLMVGLLAAALLAQPTTPATPPLTNPESLAYVRNDGQWDQRALYKGSAPGLDLWVTQDGLTLDFYRLEGRQPRRGPLASTPAKTRQGHVVRLSVVGASGAKATPRDMLPGTVNYAAGASQVTGAPRYDEITLSRIAPGIDARFYYDKGQPRYDLIVAPGANPGEAKLRYEGATNLRVGADGRLRYDTALGTVEERDLFVYQDEDGQREQIAATRIVNADGTVSVKLGAYDETQPVVIDPVVWATYLGGSTNYDYATDVDVDRWGYPVVSGYTMSTDFPKKTGSYAGPVQQSGFVCKFSADGKVLQWSTMLGAGQTVESIAVDWNKTVVVTGKATTRWPSVYPGEGTAPAGWSDSGQVGVARLAANGGSVVMARRFGGSGTSEHGSAVAIDKNGNILVGGETSSEDFPTTSGTVQPVRPSSANELAFVAKLTTLGEGIWSTYLGNDGYSYIKSIAVDPNGYVLACGGYRGQGMPRLPDNSLGSEFGFLAKLNPSGNTFAYASSFRSNVVDPDVEEPPVFVSAVDVDKFGNAVVLGSTNYDFDQLIYQKSGGSSSNIVGDCLGSGDVFVAKVSGTGEVSWSKILGGSGFDFASDLSISPLGRIFAVMYTNSTDFTVTVGRQPDGSGDAWVCTFETDGTMLRSEVFGGTDYDEAHAASAVDSSNVYIAGELYSNDLPDTQNSYRATYAGNGDSFLMRVVVGVLPPPMTGLSLSESVVIGSPTRKVMGYVEFEAPLTEARILNIHRRYTTDLRPYTVKVPVGATSASFSVYTESVMNQVDGLVTVNEAEMGSLSAPLTLLPPDIASIELSTSETLGSTQVQGTVWLGTVAGAGGQQVKFNVLRWPSLEPAPELGLIAPCTVPQGGTSQHFVIRTKSVPTTTQVVVQGPEGVLSPPLTLLPPTVQGLRIVRHTVYGGKIFAYGYVDLTAPAADGGYIVHLQTSIGTLNATTLTVPKGYRSWQFRVYTTPTHTIQTGTVTCDETPSTVNFTVLPPELDALVSYTASVVRGGKVGIRIRLTSPAPAGGVTVNLGVVDNVAGVSVPATVTVPEKATFLLFYAQTSPTMDAPQPVTIKATWKGVERTHTFTVNP